MREGAGMRREAPAALALLLLLSAAGSAAMAADTSGAGGGNPPATAPPRLDPAAVDPAPAAPLPWKNPESSDILGDARSRGYLTLDDCYRIAVRENERIGRAQEDYTQAELIKLQARGTILPQVTLEDNYYHQNQVTLPPPSGSTASAFSFADSRNQVLLHMTQPIFHGFRELNFFKYANSNIESFQFALEDSRRLLYINVAQIFYLALQLEGEVKALEDTVQVEQARVKEIQARHEAGLARKTEVLLVESQLAQDESRLTSTRNDVQVARKRLTFLLTVPVDLPLRDESAEGEMSPPGSPSPGSAEAGPAGAAGAVTGDNAELAELIRVARGHRSDLKQREAAVRAAESQVSVARGARLPSIDLDAYGYIHRVHYSEFQEQTDWSAEIDFTFPVFDGGLIKSNVLTARSKYQQAVLDRDELARQVELEVQAAYLTLASDRAQLKTLEVSVASADENYNLVKEEYRSGLATNLEVFAAQNQLLSARLDLERQKYQVGLDRAALALAQGLLPGVPAGAPGAAPPPPAEGTGTR
jgi:outer membrane protein